MMGGLLPAAALQLSAMAIYNTTNDLCFMISNGIAVAIATRLAGMIDAFHPPPLHPCPRHPLTLLKTLSTQYVVQRIASVCLPQGLYMLILYCFEIRT